MLVPRPYQSRVVDDLWTFFNEHPEGNPIVEACVGAGKSMMVAMIAQRAMTEYVGTRILVIVPSKELLIQNVEELYAVWPEARAGVYSAAVKSKQLGYDLTYATIGSIYRQAHALGRIDLILADECHGINPKDTGMWRSLINDLRRYGSPARVVGLTGTPFRGNGAWLTCGDEPLFTNVCTRVTIRELLDLGFLSPLTTIETKTHIDVSEARTVAGDYNLQDLAKLTDKDELVQAAADEIVVMGAPRKKWLVFAVNVAHAEHVCAALIDRGIPTAVVTGDTPSAQRDGAIAAYRRGELRCLVNVSVLTTGFNVRDIDFLVLLRATSLATAHKVFNRFRLAVQEYPFPQVGQVTVTLGFVSTSRGAPVEILGQADQALYYAKENGRNQVCFYDELIASGQLKTKVANDDVELF